MARFSGYILLFPLLLFIMAPPAVFSADEILLPEDENSGTFLDAKTGDEDVQIFLSGSWKANLSASAGFGWTSFAGFDSSLSYPGISDGFSFSQSPDITASLLIFDRYIFEAAFTDDFEDSTFMLGYRGMDGEFIQSVSVGNMGINISDDILMSDYFYIPGGGPSSFGIHSSFAGPFSKHELLLRFDPEEELSKTWIGQDSVLEIEINVHEYLKGQFFYVPQAPADAEFYLETDASADSTLLYDNRNYFQPDADSFSYSTTDGLLYLSSKPKGAVLVKSESTGGILLKLYEPGIFSEFESAAAYDLNTVLPDDKWKTRVYLAPDAESIAAGIELTTEMINEDGIVIINPSAGGIKEYPLQGIISNPEKVYGSQSIPAEGVISQKLIFQIREAASGYSIDNPVPGTIRIYINGIENFDWNESAGTINFNNEPAAEDRIKIIYRKKSGGSTGGDILLASANLFEPGGGWAADVNAGLRLNISGDYSLPGEETSAFGGLSAGVRYDSAVKNKDSIFTIKAGITAGIKLLTENSAGSLLLKDMSGELLNVTLNSDTVFPASLSETLAGSLDISNSNRGKLLYKDYRLPAGILSYLQDYTESPDSSLIFSPENSTAADRYKAGPYTAAARNDSRSGEVLIMDYILPEIKSWVGVQIPISAGSGNLDLSAVNAISFDCKTEGVLTGIDLYLEIGSISEDLDGDGSLDAETSEYSSGFIFNDHNTDDGTLIGGDNLTGNNGKIDSEDFNINGFIDKDKPDAIAIFNKIDKPGSDWQRLTYYFTDSSETSQNSQKRLKNAEFIRITAVNTSTGEKTGRILFDDFQFEGSAMFADDDDGWLPPDFSETAETLISAAEKPSEYLSASTLSAGSENMVMRINWDDWNNNWKLHSYISPVPAFEYGSIIFYTYCPVLSPSETDPVTIDFNMLDAAGKGIHASIPLSTGSAWRRIEIKTGNFPGSAASNGEVLIDGDVADNAELTIDAEASALYLLELSTSGADSGTLFIDEISLENPKLHTVTGLSADIEAAVTEPIITIGNLSIIGPLNFTAEASADVNTDTAALEGGLSQAIGQYGSINIYSALETNIFTAPFSADINWISGSTGNLAAGHKLEIPLFSGGLIITDSFSTDEVSGGNFSKTNSVSVNAGIFSGKIGSFQASYDSNLLIRKWFSELNTKIDFFSLGLSFELLLSDLNHAFVGNNYFTGWYDGTVLSADFSTAELQQRKTVISAMPTLTTTPAGFKSELSLTSDIDNKGMAQNSADISLGMPLSFNTGANLLAFDFTYSRSGSFTYQSGSAGFDSDIANLFTTMGGRSYLFTSIPFYELFDSSLTQKIFDDCSGAGIDSAAFINSFQISVSRNYSSRLIDLLLPYSIEFILERDIRKDFNESEEVLGLDLIWRSAALNLFGSAGVYPFFDFYFSDELNWSVEAAVKDPFSGNAVQEYIIKSGWSLFGHEEDIFSIDGSVYLPLNLEDTSSSVKTGFMYVWNQYPKTAIDLPLFTAKDEQFQIITHEEKLSLNFEKTFSAELRHSTSLILPQRFTLSAFGLAGLELNNLSGNNTALFGFSFGISGSVIY